MAPQVSIRRRLVAAAFLPIGVSLTSWNYMWRTTPLYRREKPGSAGDDAGPPFPDGLAADEVQGTDDGVGPLFHRRYTISIEEPDLDARELMEEVQADPNRVCPREFATFRKALGEQGRMQIGDEFVVRMPGPWDGPVRTIDVTPSSFRLATLAGHLEAGQIEFRARDEHGAVVFEIESWARSGDRFSNILFQHLKMAKEIQLHMWTSVLERVAKLAGGRRPGGVDIDTKRVDEDALAG